MDKRKNLKQFLLFCFVGLINTIVDLTLYFILHQFIGIPAVIASPIVVFIVMSVSYILNAKIVFISKLSFRQYLEFMLLTGTGVIVIQTTMSALFENWAQEFLLNLNVFQQEDLNIFIANSIVRIAGVTFSLAWNFLFYKYVVFRFKHEEKDNKVKAVDREST